MTNKRRRRWDGTLIHATQPQDHFRGNRSLLASCWFNRTVTELVQKSGFTHQLVEQAPPVDEGSRGVKFGHSALLENDNPIRIEDSVDPMSDRDDGTIIEDVAAKCCLQQGVCLDVDCSCRFVEYQDVAGCQKCSRQ